MLLKTSLPMGCVTFNDKFFTSFPFQKLDFDDAKAAVKSALGDYLSELKHLGWHCVVGASGSVQSVVELLNYRQESASITLDVLTSLQEEVLTQSSHSMLSISGLHQERAPTFAAGISILRALFELLEIESLNLSGGALREGVLQTLAQRIEQVADSA